MLALSKTCAILSLACLCSCASRKGEPFSPEDDDPTDPGLPSIAELFGPPQWPTGGRFSPTGTPPFDVRGPRTPVRTDEPVGQSDPTFAQLIPLDEDEIAFLAWAKEVLDPFQLDTIGDTYEGGFPTSLGDLVVLPTIGRFTTPDTRYVYLQAQTQADLVTTRRLAEPGRTRVIGIAFGNGSGGYVPSEPYTADTFAGALVWMKATQNPSTGRWGMDQRDWRQGVGAPYGTTLVLLVRGNSIMAIIAEEELEEIGATRVRFDLFSYTTDVRTEWSHDYTDWIPLPE